MCRRLKLKVRHTPMRVVGAHARARLAWSCLRRVKAAAQGMWTSVQPPGGACDADASRALWPSLQVVEIVASPSAPKRAPDTWFQGL